MMQSQLPQRVQFPPQQIQYTYISSTGRSIQLTQVSHDFKDGSPSEVFLLISGLLRPLRKHRGHLIEIDEQTLNHKSLQTKIRVECKGTSSIPHMSHFVVIIIGFQYNLGHYSHKKTIYSNITSPPKERTTLQRQISTRSEWSFNAGSHITISITRDSNRIK